MMCDLDVLHTTAQRTAAPLPAPSQILRSSFAHPSHILRTSFPHPPYARRYQPSIIIPISASRTLLNFGYNDRRKKIITNKVQTEYPIIIAEMLYLNAYSQILADTRRYSQILVDTRRYS